MTELFWAATYVAVLTTSCFALVLLFSIHLMKRYNKETKALKGKVKLYESKEVQRQICQHVLKNRSYADEKSEVFTV